MITCLFPYLSGARCRADVVPWSKDVDIFLPGIYGADFAAEWETAALRRSGGAYAPFAFTSAQSRFPPINRAFRSCPMEFSHGAVQLPYPILLGAGGDWRAALCRPLLLSGLVNETAAAIGRIAEEGRWRDARICHSATTSWMSAGYVDIYDAAVQSRPA